jgi:hypothetical protein
MQRGNPFDTTNASPTYKKEYSFHGCLVTVVLNPSTALVKFEFPHRIRILPTPMPCRWIIWEEIHSPTLSVDRLLHLHATYAYVRAWCVSLFVRARKGETKTFGIRGLVTHTAGSSRMSTRRRRRRWCMCVPIDVSLSILLDRRSIVLCSLLRY